MTTASTPTDLARPPEETRVCIVAITRHGAAQAAQLARDLPEAHVCTATSASVLPANAKACCRHCCTVARGVPRSQPRPMARARATGADDWLATADMAQAVVASSVWPMGGRYTTRRSAQSAQRVSGTSAWVTHNTALW